MILSRKTRHRILVTVKMTKKSIVEQIVALVTKPLLADKINRENFQTLEIEIRGGKVDGARIKEYIKADKINDES